MSKQIDFTTTQDEAGFSAVIVVDGEEVGEIVPPNPEVDGDVYTVFGWEPSPGWSHELRPTQGFDDAKAWVTAHVADFRTLEETRDRDA